MEKFPPSRKWHDNSRPILLLTMKRKLMMMMMMRMMMRTWKTIPKQDGPQGVDPAVFKPTATWFHQGSSTTTNLRPRQDTKTNSRYSHLLLPAPLIPSSTHPEVSRPAPSFIPMPETSLPSIHEASRPAPSFVPMAETSLPSIPEASRPRSQLHSQGRDQLAIHPRAIGP